MLYIVLLYIVRNRTIIIIESRFSVAGIITSDHDNILVKILIMFHTL